MKSTWPVVFVVAALALLRMAQANSDEPGKKSPAPAVDPMLGKKAGEVRDDNGLKMKLVWCPPGVVTMEQVETVTEPAPNKNAVSNDDEVVDPKDDPAPKPKKTIKITPVKAFVSHYWLGKCEVTQFEWIQVMNTEPWKKQEFTKEGVDFPATYISWDDATDFCRKLTQQERQAGRLPEAWEYTLPTEAQWERACRARTESKFSFGDDESQLQEYAWFGATRETAAHEVGQKKPNPWGLHDMHGNIWEWCRDSYTEKLPGGRDPEVKSDDATKASKRVLRGGGWFFGAASCRSGFRCMNPPDIQYFHSGFRVALSAVR